MTDPTPNIPLLRKTLEHIENHPDKWNQRAWASRSPRSACGTAYCFAGTAIQLSGETFDWKWHGGGSEYGVLADGTLRYASEFAAELLGLPVPVADMLFSGSNRLDKIRELVADIIGEPL